MNTKTMAMKYAAARMNHHRDAKNPESNGTTAKNKNDQTHREGDIDGVGTLTEQIARRRSQKYKRLNALSAWQTSRNVLFFNIQFRFLEQAFGAGQQILHALIA
ncbi:hypothetical protein [Terriglobus saanensis]|uniref:hypothetical protein n=1 Tax=Terriglobus saanensis TaxID=870903 RepID=UPI0016510362|nr:hypothetical protein [Terriglobus saanensis]